MNLRGVDTAVELVVPLNYQIGRAASPTVAAAEGELLTLAANIRTRFPAGQQAYYRFWMELEFLDGQKVIASAASPELTGTHEAEQLLAVTAAAPRGTNSVRAALCAQNKYWSLLENAALIREIRLLKLDGFSGENPALEVITPLPNQPTSREARVAVNASWPDGTAVALQSSRGSVPRTPTLLPED